MKILVLNSGSSSLKFQLINMKDESVLAKGLCERIGLNNSILNYKRADMDQVFLLREMRNQKDALNEVASVLTDKDFGAISNLNEIAAVGHRVAQGGERFCGSVKINDDVIKALKDYSDIAPLHNPPMIAGIESCREIMPDTLMAGVFDTAFHQTMPEHAYLYALPYEMYEKYRIRKYGFHGTSHKYVTQRAAQILKRPVEELKLISCHLGNGASVCAVKDGESIDTSMGFTPLEGLVMGTRSGTLDPAVIWYLMEKEKLSLNEISDFLNKKSGMLGISGVSSDFRDIEAAANEGNYRCKLAIEIFCYRVKKYIGEYYAVVGGLDAVIFTAGIGENAAAVRQKVMEGMEHLGISIDVVKNSITGKETDISTRDAQVRTLVIPTNEELAIARETMKLIVS